MQDLWADFAGEILPMEEGGKGRGPRQRRLTEQAVLTDLRAWLLHDYLLPYATSLGATRIFQRCYWIDGLDMTRAAAQTALQPVETLAQKLAQLERPIALHGFVLAQKSGRRRGEPAQERQNGSQPSEGVTIPATGGLLHATWPELGPKLLATLEQSAAVFLLDPLKDGLFGYADLEPLYKRTAPTELFLWLSHKQIETGLLPGLRTGEGGAALTRLLRGDRWKKLLAKEQDANNPQNLINGLVKLWAESMRPAFLSVQCLSFPVLSGPAHVAAAPYTLLFATRRQDSLGSLNDALCRRKRSLVATSHQGVLNEDWFASQREEQSTAAREALTQEILALGRAHNIRRWPDLRQQLLLAHFGHYTLAEYDQLITTLLARGSVRCDWQKYPQQTPEEARLPGHGDLLLWR